MSSERDPTRIVLSWLRSDEHVSADRLLDAVLFAVDTTPQRRSSWLAWRSPLMSNTVRTVLAAAAVVVVALIGYQLLIAPNVGGTPPTASPSLSPSDSSAPSEQAASSPSPRPTPGGVANLADQEGPLEPGTYVITDISPMTIFFTVPPSWEKLSAPAVVWAAPSSNASVSFKIVTDMFADPCDLSAGYLGVGPTVDDLAAALAEFPSVVHNSTTDVTLAGFEGKLVDLQGEEGLCPGGDPVIYTAVVGAETYDAPHPGHGSRVVHEQIYILDVEGERLVVAATDRAARAEIPGASDQERAEMQGIVDSIVIETP